ncbi:periodic tryptophan protein [Cyclospora cayetanensis]|uniref:Periodic tryptophan protein n=1 Tax=Cyclospora cayetanensis TaxID=88456 RepID=A0A1D3D1Q0_9EIME|nr:periodic tryptophan protein [Cyclospora cayetanensis]
MFSYEFSNLLAAPYSSSHAHITFDRKSSSLYAPSSNRVCRYTLTTTNPATSSSTRKDHNTKSAFDSALAAQANSEEIDGTTSGSSKVCTLPFEARVDVQHFCVRSDGCLAISIDLQGQGLVVNLVKGTILNRIRFRSNTSSARLKWEAQRKEHFVSAAAFSPDDLLFAVACGRTIQVEASRLVFAVPSVCRYCCPSPVPVQACVTTVFPASAPCKQLVELFMMVCLLVSSHSCVGVCSAALASCAVQLWRSPSVASQYQLHLLHAFTLHQQPISCLSWSPDSIHLLSGSQDCTVRLWRARGKWAACKPAAALEASTEASGANVDASEAAHQAYRDQVDAAFVPSAFTSHRHEVKFVCFSCCLTRVYSVNREGCIICWTWQSLPEAEERFGEAFDAHKNAAKPINPQFFQQQRDKKQQQKRQQARQGEEGDKEAAVEAVLRPPDEFIDYSEGLWRLEKRAYCKQENGQRVSHAATNISPYYKYAGVAGKAPENGFQGFHGGLGGRAPPQYLLIGFTGGVFQLYLLPDLSAIVRLSLGVSSLDSVCLSFDGEWVAAAAAESNTLVVWEWRSETYVLRQQAHMHGIHCKADSVIARLPATRLLSLPFASHRRETPCFQPPLTGQVYTARSSAAATFGFEGPGGPTSSSLDSGVQFTCVAIDSGGELLVAGSQGSCFSAFVWSVRTAKLLEELVGHEAPVAAVAFHPHPDRQGILATGSWDMKVKLWDILGRRSRGGCPETLIQSGGVSCLAFDPKGRGLLAVGGEGGKVALWDSSLGEEGALSCIECLRDIQGGRAPGDRTAKNVWATKEKKVLLYETEGGALLGSFLLTSNRMLEGISRELNSKFIADDGTAIQEYDLSDVDDDLNEGERERKRIRHHRSLPGVLNGELASKNNRLFLVNGVSFSGDSRSFAAATSHGLFVYSISLQGGMIGNFGSSEIGRAPPLLTRQVTSANIYKALNSQEYAKAFLLALVANDMPTLLCVYERIPVLSVPLVCSSLSPSLLPALLFFLQTVLSPDVQIGTRHIQFHILWLSCLLKLQMHVFQGGLARHWTETVAKEVTDAQDEKARRADAFERLSRISVDLRTLFLLVLRQLQQQHTNLHSTFSSNLGTLSFLCATIRNRHASTADSTTCSD